MKSKHITKVEKNVNWRVISRFMTSFIFFSPGIVGYILGYGGSMTLDFYIFIAIGILFLVDSIRCLIIDKWIGKIVSTIVNVKELGFNKTLVEIASDDDSEASCYIISSVNKEVPQND